MNAFVRRLVAATLPVISAATLFAGSAPARADLTLPPPGGDSAIERCLRNGGTPEQCAALLNPTPAPQGGLNPSLTPVRHINNVRLTNVTASSSATLSRPAQLIRAR